MNTQELDRLLCERLGIRPINKVWHVVAYPALSTTGDGMLMLEVSLRAAKMGWAMYGNWRGVEAKVGNDFVSTAIDDSASLAFALAAAAALGIEVPE